MKPIILALATLALTTAMPAQDPPATLQDATEQSYTTIVAWPMEGCVVSGKALKEGKAKTFEVDGRTFKTCCGKCQGKVEKDPEKYAAKLDKAIIAAQLKSYPLEVCVLSNKKLGDKTKNMVLEDTLVRVCCGRCEKKAPAKSEALVAKVVAASYAAQAKSYAVEKCPISGHELDNEPTEVMYGTTLVRLCCDDCIDEFRASPAAAMAKLDKASGKATSKPSNKKGEDAGEDGCSSEGGSCCSEKPGAAKSCCEEKAAKPAAKGCCEEKAEATPKKSKV